jgi:riboflavin kinase/FMN adenylyltransferase
MQVLQGIEGLKRLPAGGVLSVGNFDGIHLGHRTLIERARELCDRDGGEIAIVTFEPHPLTVLRPAFAPPRLTPPDIKARLLDELGVGHCVVLPPTPEVLNLSAEAFWHIVRDEVRPRHMIEGRSFNFGKGRGGNIQRLREWAAQSDVELHVLEPVETTLLDLNIVEVNSSLIRWLLALGRVRDAAICLGRPYLLRGEVVAGHRRGREIGVPTANLKCEDQLVPLDGVYAGRCRIDGTAYAAAVSIGTMPTFGENARQIEAHILGFAGDLYGRDLEVEMTDWIREQRRYPSIEPLKVQIARDIAISRQRREFDPARPIAV